jgi:hypothetical protein
MPLAAISAPSAAAASTYIGLEPELAPQNTAMRLKVGTCWLAAAPLAAELLSGGGSAASMAMAQRLFDSLKKKKLQRRC